MPRQKALMFANTNDKKAAIQKLKEDLRLAKERVNSLKNTLKAENAQHAAKLREYVRLEKQHAAEFAAASDALDKAINAPVEVDGRSKAARATKWPLPATGPAIENPPVAPATPARKRRANGQTVIQGA